ncbi:MAG: O-antigen ligase family protein [Methylococcales bacterium]
MSKIKPHFIMRKTRNIYITLIFLSLLSLSIPYINENEKFSYVDALISIKSVLLDGLLFYIVYFYYTLNINESRFMLQLLVIIIGVAAFLTFIDAATNAVSIFGFDLVETNRPLGAFGEPNQTALIIALYTPFIISICLVGNMNRFVSISCAIFCFSAIVMTSSRGGIVSLCVGLLVFIWMAKDNLKIEQKLLMSISLPMGSLVGWFVLPTKYTDLILDRFSFIGNNTIDFQEASAGRTYLWDVGYKMWLDSPIFGNGWTAFKSTTGAAIHNTLLEYLVGMGLIGAALFMYLWYTIFVFVSKTRKYCHSRHDTIIISGLAAGIIALLTGLLFVNLYITWFFVWIYAGITMAYCNIIRYRYRLRNHLMVIK